MNAEDTDRLRRVLVFVKMRFPNLTATEAFDLSVDLLRVIDNEEKKG